MSAVFVTPSGPPTLPVPPAPKPTVEPLDPVDAMRAARSTEPAVVLAMARTDAAVALGWCGWCLEDLGGEFCCGGNHPDASAAAVDYEAAPVLSRPVRWSS